MLRQPARNLQRLQKRWQFSIFAKRNKLPECLTQADALLKAQESRRLELLRLCPDKRVKCYLLKLPFFWT